MEMLDSLVLTSVLEDSVDMLLDNREACNVVVGELFLAMDKKEVREVVAWGELVKVGV